MSNDIRSEVRALPMGDVTTVTPASAQRVLRNTYALLGLTLAFSALVAGLAMSLKLPHPGILVTLVAFTACSSWSTRRPTAARACWPCSP